MEKHILIISSSPRKGSNSEALAIAFANGAKDAGHSVEMVTLARQQINYCRGCFACQKLLRCVLRDDGDIIEQKMHHADVLVFASPIYYYNISGQLKTMLDRGNPLFCADYKFREVYFLSAAAEEGEDVPKRAISSIQGWVECFDKATLKGSVFCGGVTNPGDIEGRQELKQAYEMGANV